MSYEIQPLRHVIGFLGSDPEKKTSKAKELPYVQFSLGVQATTDYKGRTHWYSVAVFNEELREEVLKDLHKGSAVGASGIASERVVDGRTFYNLLASTVYKVQRMGRKMPPPRETGPNEDF